MTRHDIKQATTLKQGLEKLYKLFDRSFISPDPLECVPLKGNFKDKELSAFIAASFAYGRAELIVKTVGYILGELGGKPHATLMSGRYKTKFKNFKYRFHKRADLLWFLGRLAKIYAEYGTLEKAFLKGGDNQKDRLRNFSQFFNGAGKLTQAKKFLVPSPAGSSACKRLNLFLRWMVRKDSLDLGLWEKASPADLIIPLDVHVHRIATRIGLVSDGPANYKRAEELTANLRLMNANDPVRYDFAICSLGKLGHCGKTLVKEKCIKCVLRGHCSEI